MIPMVLFSFIYGWNIENVIRAICHMGSDSWVGWKHLGLPNV